MKKILVWIIGLLLMTNVAEAQQINSIDDFVDHLQELRTISQKMGKYYILRNLYPTNEAYKKSAQESIDKFNQTLILLTEQAPTEELSIELQKLNLTWLYVNKVLQGKYDRMAAAKVLDKLEDLQKEAASISDMAMKLTKKELAKIIKKSTEARVMVQRMNLYYIANRAKIINPAIQERFEDSVQKLQENIKYLENSPLNDESTNMILEMVKGKIKTFGRNISLKSKVSPLTANMVAEGLDQDFILLTRVYKDRLSNK